MAQKKGKIITFSSVKGGVGKTTFLLAMAGLYANKKNKVLIIDMDLFSGDIEAILTGKSKKDLYTLFEDMTNNNFYDLDDYITNYNENIDFIASPKDPRYANQINASFISLLFSRVSGRYDIILVDTNHFLNEINLVTFDNSNEIVYIINNTSMNLKNMRTMISIFTDMKLTKYKIVLYDARDKNKNVFKKFDIRTIIKDNIDYIIPNDFYMKDIDKYIIDNKLLEITTKNIKKKNSRLFDKIAKDLIK